MRSLDDELIHLLRRLQAERPMTWCDDIAQAVHEVGGSDACDILGLAADSAASGYDRSDAPHSKPSFN